MSQPVASTVSKPATPELDKQADLIATGHPAAVQEFYDWLIQNGYVIGRYQEVDGYSDAMLVPAPITPEQLLANHFGIDRGRIEAERRALLDYLGRAEQ